VYTATKLIWTELLVLLLRNWQLRKNSSVAWACARRN